MVARKVKSNCPKGEACQGVELAYFFAGDRLLLSAEFTADTELPPEYWDGASEYGVVLCSRSAGVSDS